MHRLCIYILYDGENIIDDYISNILKEMKLLCEKVVVVINAEDVKKKYTGNLSCADRVIVRENKGYDAGAYKDCICNYLMEEVQEFDEIVLMNDSFYGPIYPIEDSFRLMEWEAVDYWGMTKHNEAVYPEHIQSYFLVLREKIVKDENFYEFWNDFQYPATLEEAIQNFEIGFNLYLKENGFCGKALTELYDVPSLKKSNANPYMMNSLELIRDTKVPFLKRKSIDISNDGYQNALEAYRYLEDNHLYDVNIIKKHLTRKCEEDRYAGLFNLKELDEFCHKYKKIYIYGAGIVGRNLSSYFEYKNILSSGYLVTKIDGEAKKNVYPFGELAFDANVGIIIAVANKHVALEILETVKEKYSEEHIFAPNYIQQKGMKQNILESKL